MYEVGDGEFRVWRPAAGLEGERERVRSGGDARGHQDAESARGSDEDVERRVGRGRLETHAVERPGGVRLEVETPRRAACRFVACEARQPTTLILGVSFRPFFFFRNFQKERGSRASAAARVHAGRPVRQAAIIWKYFREY